MSRNQWTTAHTDYYRNPVNTYSTSKNISTVGGGTTYNVKATIVVVPYDVEKGHYYMNMSQVTNWKVNLDDYGYSFPISRVYCIVQFIQSDSPVQFVNSNTTLKIQIGNNNFNIKCYSSRYSNNYVNGVTYNNSIKIDCGYRYHNPSNGQRSSETCSISLTSYDSNGINGSLNSVNVSYATLYVASAPTLNYYTFYIPYGSSSYADDVVITTNRINSNLTHDLYVSIGVREYSEMYGRKIYGLLC